MFKNILFDLDGTIANSSEGITKCAQYGLAALGIDEPDLKKLYVVIGPPLRVTYMKYWGLTAEQAELGVAKYRERYTTTGIYEQFIFPGMEDLLKDLARTDKNVGLCTGKPEVYARIITDHFQLTQYFKDISGSTLDGKMDNKSTVVAKSLCNFKITDDDKANTYLIGDRKEDVLAAHANGIKAVGVRFGFAQAGELEEAGADIIVDTVEDLRKLLLE
ncbi:MAG: HAD hydrolase-like protein [Phascolarctobacterium sp.]|nr:HAD hydrolase-like protein [Phascolarctobacterium sp.]